MKSIIRYLLILSLFAVSSCFREPFENDGPCPCDDEKKVTLKLALPYTAPRGPDTRSIMPVQENFIETLDILAFKVENDVETFLYWSEATKQTGNTDGAQTQSFNAMLRVKDFTQRFVLVSNARSKVAKLIGSRVSGGWEGIEKEALLSQLIFDLNGSDRWNVFSASNYTPIPMTGESAPITVSDATSTISGGPIQMLRMIAKIEVQLDTNVAGLTDLFQLTSVHLYNTNTSGRIIPIPEHIGDDKIALLPSLPDPVETVEGPLAYADFGSPGLTGVAMRGAIYLFETEAKNTGVIEETCIVVGGHYNGDLNETFYRLDFLVPETATHLDILRNHRYTCSITDVKGAGHPTVEEAYRTKVYNMETDILVWDEGNISDIVFDSQFMLGVSKNPFELGWEAQHATSLGNILKITTDVPNGWSATVWEDIDATQPSAWLNINPRVGGGGALPNEMRLLAETNLGPVRTAYIHIKAGRLIYKLLVKQGNSSGDDELITLETNNSKISGTNLTAGENYVIVTCKKTDGSDDPNAAWTLVSSNPDYFRLSLNPATDFASASSSLSGAGTQTVYLIVKENNGLHSQSTSIYLEGSSSDVEVNILQFSKPNNTVFIDGFGEPPKDAITYVGAFWRASQTGERLIRIDVGDNKSNWGEWTASVIWMDDRWGNDDAIVLSTRKSADPNIYTSAPGNAENFQVEGYASTVTGNVLNPYIFFRIGLKKPYTPTDDHPARYAVILLSYAKNSKHQKIYLRQGERPDYLMKNSDPITSLPSQNGNLSARTQSRKISPYNLTANVFRTDIGVNGGKLVDYPTQAGAFFQWSHIINVTYGRLRWAWEPHFISMPTAAAEQWWGGVNGTYWSSSRLENETSPAGFRRVNDGSISAYTNSNSNISASELRQSLFMGPLVNGATGSTTNKHNTIYGYYADGFFDRRELGTPVNGKLNSAVAEGTRDFAYSGRLFVNQNINGDHYNASLFFPLAGWRNSSTGALSQAGDIGYYWTSSLSAANTASALYLRDNSVYPNTAAVGYGMSIRPIADEGY